MFFFETNEGQEVYLEVNGLSVRRVGMSRKQRIVGSVGAWHREVQRQW